ncbi:MAG: cell envelope integrity protein TolA [Nitrosomonadales bacterium]|nr:cell envelope integrity protein TolA [Nitrosomonadales bacterium]
MSAAVFQEHYRLPAGILTLAVHGAFFALLYLGFTWQTTPPAMMSVELWQSLPEEIVVPSEAASPSPAQTVEEAAPPEKVLVPDIALPDKKKVEARPEAKKPAKQQVAKPVEAVVPKPDTAIADREAAKERAEMEKAAQEQAAREQALLEQAARERAEKEAATGRIVDEHKAKIMAKIRRNIVMPANVPDDARAEFSVTLLPGGAVLEAKLLKASGNAAYDSAVERAILKSDPLPLPPDVSLFNKFRQLKLVFRPTE